MKSELPDTTTFALKTELPDTTKFALKADIPANIVTTGNVYNALNANLSATQWNTLLGKSTNLTAMSNAIQTNKTDIAAETTARTNAISSLSSVYAPKSLETTVASLNTSLGKINTTLNTTVATVNEMNTCGYNSAPTCGNNGYTGGYTPIAGTGLTIGGIIMP